MGACVGLNGARVNSVVSELNGEKIDIINWDDNPALLIENALSPAKVIFVAADEEAREAQVIVPDYQPLPGYRQGRPERKTCSKAYRLQDRH